MLFISRILQVFIIVLCYVFRDMGRYDKNRLFVVFNCVICPDIAFTNCDPVPSVYPLTRSFYRRNYELVCNFAQMCLYGLLCF